MDQVDSDRELFLNQSKTVEKSDEAESDDDFLFRFKEPLNEKELKDKIEKRIPKNTKYKIDWALSVFKRWQEERRSRSIDNNLDIPSECLKTELSEMSAADLNIGLKYFLFEAAKKDRTDYPSNTLYGLYGALHLKAQYSQYNLFEDDEFREARAALDAVMKERAAAGLGAASRKSAEIITETDENMLWESGILGDDTPQKLVDTILYLTGLHFSLRGGQEHRRLRLFKDPQITAPHTDDNGRQYLLYKEDVSKSNTGGLGQRKVVPKEVRAYDCPNSEKCYVRLYQKYRLHCKAAGEETNAFYFTPLKKPKPGEWFSRVPIGHNTLKTTVKRLCAAAGIQGRKTNHSLRTTSATRLHRSGVSEQLICEQTGHRSEAVRVYKKSSDDQKASVSDLLCVVTDRKRKVDSKPTAQTSEPESKVSVSCGKCKDKQYSLTINFN